MELSFTLTLYELKIYRFTSLLCVYMCVLFVYTSILYLRKKGLYDTLLKQWVHVQSILCFPYVNLKNYLILLERQIHRDKEIESEKSSIF